MKLIYTLYEQGLLITGRCVKVVHVCQEGVYCDCCGGIFLEKFMSELKYVTDFNSNDTYSQVYTNFFAATKKCLAKSTITMVSYGLLNSKNAC